MGESMGLKNGSVRIGNLLPLTSCGVGQLINDAHAMILGVPTTWDEAWAAVDAYEAAAINARNVAFWSGRGSEWLYATRNIDVGEELFLDYGIRYWVYHTLSTTPHPLLRVLAFMLTENGWDDSAEPEMPVCCTVHVTDDGRQLPYLVRYDATRRGLVDAEGGPLNGTTALRFFERFIRVGGDADPDSTLPVGGQSLAPEFTPSLGRPYANSPTLHANPTKNQIHTKSRFAHKV